MHGGDITVMGGKLLIRGVEFCDCESIIRGYEGNSILLLKRTGGESILIYRNGTASIGPVYQEITLISTDHLSYIARRAQKDDREVWDYVYGSTLRTFASVRVVKGVNRWNAAYGAGHILIVGTTTENDSILCYGPSALSLGRVDEIHYMDRDRDASSSFEHLRGRTILALRTVSWNIVCWVLENGNILQGPFAHKPYALARSGEAITLNVSEDENRVEGISIGGEHHDLTDLYRAYEKNLEYVRGTVTEFQQFGSFIMFRIHSGNNRVGKWYDHTLIWDAEKGFRRFTGTSHARQFNGEVGRKPLLTIAGEWGNRLSWGGELMGPPLNDVLQVSMGAKAPIALVMKSSYEFILIEGDTVLDPQMRDAYVPAYDENGHSIGMSIRFLPVGTKAVYAKREPDGTEAVYVNGEKIMAPLMPTSVKKVIDFRVVAAQVEVTFINTEGKQDYTVLCLE